MDEQTKNDEIPEDIKQALHAYRALQQEEAQLKERKRSLQETLKAYLRKQNSTVCFPVVDGERLKVRYRSEVNIEYDEDLLRKRLGDAYPEILEPDIRKLRKHLPELRADLQPLLGRIGTPSPEKIKLSIASGKLSKADFSGAFTKELKEYIAVSHLPSPPSESPLSS